MREPTFFEKMTEGNTVFEKSDWAPPFAPPAYSSMFDDVRAQGEKYTKSTLEKHAILFDDRLHAGQLPAYKVDASQTPAIMRVPEAAGGLIFFTSI